MQTRSIGTALLAALALTVASGGVASAALIQVDLADADTNPGSGWNTIASGDVTGHASDIALSDSDDLPTSVKVGFTGDWLSSGNTNQGGAYATTQGAAFGLAADDYVYVEGLDDHGAEPGTTQTGTMTFTGLQANADYIVTLAGARASSGDQRHGNYLVNGNYTTSGVSSNLFDAYVDGTTNGSVMVWTANAGASGTITIDVAALGEHLIALPDTTSDPRQFAYLSAATLEAVPEPASLSLLLAGGLMIGARRRH